VPAETPRAGAAVARHREQDRDAKRDELENQRRPSPSRAAAIDAQLARLAALTDEQLLRSGPDDGGALIGEGG
jgi:hypothetical protein